MKNFIRKINISKKKTISVFLILAIFIFIFSSFALDALAAFNKQINYQGKLTTSAFVPVANGTYNMEFKIYDSVSNLVWTETRTGSNKVQVTSGIFSVMLGEVTPLAGIDFNQTIYLGVNIGGTASTPAWDGEMAPRKRLGSVPAAVESEKSAKSSNLVGGNDTNLFGSVPYQSGVDTTTLLFPNTSTVKKFFTMTGTGSNGAIPSWVGILDGDLPNTLTGKTYNALTLTALTTGFTIAGGTSNNKTLTVGGDASITGTNTGDETNTTILSKLGIPSISGVNTGDQDLSNLLVKNSLISGATNTKITYDAKGLVTGGTTLSASDIPALDWAKITTSKPTTLGGYGITDAAPISGSANYIQNQNASAQTTSNFWVNGLGKANQFQSTVATGTSPFVVTSSTVVTNLNADLLDGHDASYFQSALINPVTGTGTANYIPKFTGTSSLGNSLIYDNGTNVGIGTTTPGGILDLQSTVVYNTPIVSQKWSTQNIDYNFRLETLYSDSGINQNFVQKTSGIDHNVLSFTNGNVGIGTTNPVSTLEVNGITTVDNYINRVTANGNSSWLQQDGTGRTHWYWNTYGGASPTFTNAGEDATDLLMHTTNNGSGGFMSFREASGLGRNAGDAVAPLWSYVMTASSSGLRIGNDTSLGVLAVNKLDVVGNAAFGTYAGTAAPANGMIVSGSVGIGMTDPWTKLDVSGAVGIRSVIGTGSARPAVGTSRIAGEISGLDSGGLNSDGGFLRLSAGGGTDATIKSFIDLSGYSTNPGLDRQIQLGTNGVPRITIANGGTVGIGTTAPLGDAGDLTLGNVSGADGKLYLYGSTAGAVSTLKTTNGNLHIDATTGGYGIYLNYYNGTGGIIFGNGASGTNANVSSAGVFTGTGLTLGAGAITSGLVNGQTISGIANFTGTVGVALDVTSPYYKVTAVNGNGICFWQDCTNYKIHMGSGTEYSYGPVTEYAIKTTMGAGTSGRGWVWGGSGVAPIAALNVLGNMQIAGTMNASQFNGSGAGLTADSVPISALAHGDYSGNITSGTYGINISGNAASSNKVLVHSSNEVDIGGGYNGGQLYLNYSDGGNYTQLGFYNGATGLVDIAAGAYNGQTISGAANFTGTMAIAGNVNIGGGLSGRRLDVYNSSGGGDGLAVGQDADNTQTIQAYIDGQWTNRATYATGCCNGLKLQPDVGYVQIGSNWTVDHGGNMSGVGTISSGAITSGLINGQTISSAANFTGSVFIANGLTVGKNGGTTSMISFPAQTNDPGYISHYELNNTARMYFNVSDDSGTTDYFGFGYSGAPETSIIYSGGGITTSGPINSSVTGIQTGGTTRIDTSGNLSSIGTISTSGSATLGGNLILGGNTITTTNTGLVTNLNADRLDSLHSTDLSRAFGQTTFSSSTTTSAFVADLTAKGLFNYGSATVKGTWDYAGNNDIGDTGFGGFELAGTSIQTWTDGVNKTILAIRPTTGAGGGQVLIYNDQGSGYSPGWRQIWTDTTDGSGSGLDADLLDGQHASYFQTALTNPVTGTGTSNYLSKFTGTSSLSSSLVYDNGTNVGIGTTAPGTPLHIYYVPAVNTTVDDVVKITSKYNAVSGASAVIGSGPSILFSGGIGDNQERNRARIVAVYEGNNVSGLAFHTQDTADTITEKMRIRDNGNVGIGSTNPGQKLEISGTNTPAIKLTSSSDSSYNVQLQSNWDSSHQMSLTSMGSEVLGRYIGNTALMTGNVGIGTTSPGYTLDVNGQMRAERYRGINSLTLNTFATVNPTSNVFMYSQPNDRDSWLYLDSADTGSNWGIYHRQIDSAVSGLPGNAIGFVGGGSSALQAYISLLNGNAFFNGNVGIGALAPVARLEVDGSAGASIPFIVKANTGANGIQIKGRSDNLGYLEFFQNNGTTLEGALYGAAGRMTLTDSSSTDVLTVKSGNVGVGVTSPAAKLQVSGGYVMGDKNYGFVNADYQAGRNNVWSVSPSAVNWGISYYQGGSDYFAFHPNGSPSAPNMIIRGDGNVGIGTTNPQANLHIYQPIDRDGLIIQAPTTNSDGQQHYSALSFSEYADKSGNYSQIRSYSNLYSNWGSTMTFVNRRSDSTVSEAMRIDSLGNVGIGAGVGKRLDVTTTTNTDGIRINGNGANASLIINNTGSGGSAWDISSTGAGHSYGNGKLIFGIGFSPKMTIDGSGNVGIGTTNPGGPLEINVGSGSWGKIVFNATNEWGDGPNYATIGAGGAAGIMLSNPHITWGGGHSYVRMGRIGGVPDGAFWDAGLTTDRWDVSRNAGAPFLSVNTSGNVGIGTTNPQSKLDVNGGNIRLNEILTGTSYIGKQYTPNGNFYSYISFPSDSTGDAIAFGTHHSGVSSGERMRISMDGNVGIGTTTPYAKMEILNGTGISSFTGGTAGNLMLSGPTNVGNNYATLDFSQSSQPSIPNARIGAKFTGSGSYLQFGTSNSYVTGVTNTAMTIRYDGNVGIGTTDPADTLTVAGGGLTLYTGASWDNMRLYTDGSNSYLQGTGDETGIHLRSSAGNVLLADDRGSVGIGTAYPSSKLEVRNQTLDNTAFQNIATLYANVSNESSGESFNSGASSFGLSFKRNWSSASSNTNVAGIYGFSSGGWRGGMAFRTKNNTSPTGDTDTTAMVFSPSGNVGIGTESPGVKLQINGSNPKLSVVTNSDGNYQTSLQANWDYGHQASLTGYAGYELLGQYATNTALLYGNVGIGTTNPVSKLSVGDDGATNTGIFGYGSTTGIQGMGGDTGVAGDGLTGVAGNGDSYGVYGSSSNIGVFSYGGNYDFYGNGGEYTSGGTWVNGSDRNLKENIQVIDDKAILKKIIDLPISQWNYKTAKNAQHIGPMAQDFYLLFGLGDNNTSISTIDPAGIALVGVKALNTRIDEQKKTLDDQQVVLDEQKVLLGEQKTKLGEQQVSIDELNLYMGSITSDIVPPVGSKEETFAKVFFGNLFSKLTSWLADAGNGVGDIFAKRVKTKELCITDDTGETCFTRSQINTLLTGSAAGAPGTTTTTNGATGITATSTNTNSKIPVITLLGDATVNLKVGDAYIEQGAKVTDDVDTNLLANIAGAIDTTVAGTYEVTYNVTDSEGNKAAEVKRTVVISAPVVSDAPSIPASPTPTPAPAPVVTPEPTPAPTPAPVEPTPPLGDSPDVVNP